MALFKPAFIHALGVFDFGRTQHSLFTTDPAIPRSCATRAVVECPAEADEMGDELACIWIDYEGGGTTTSQRIVSIRANGSAWRASLNRDFVITNQSQLVSYLEGSHAVMFRWSGMIIKHPRSGFPKHGVLKIFWQAQQGLAGIPGLHRQQRTISGFIGRCL